MFNNAFSKIVLLVRLMLDNLGEPDRPQMTIWRKMIKAADIHSECVVLIAFALQQRLHGRASMSRFTYIDCIVDCPLILILLLVIMLASP